MARTAATTAATVMVTETAISMVTPSDDVEEDENDVATMMTLKRLNDSVQKLSEKTFRDRLETTENAPKFEFEGLDLGMFLVRKFLQ